MMNNNTNSLIGNRFSEQELQNGSLNGSCEDYNGSTGVWRISENEKLHEILHNRCSEQRYVYTVQKSGGSLNPAAVLSGAVLFLCAFLPFVSVNMYFYKQGEYNHIHNLACQLKHELHAHQSPFAQQFW